MAGYIGSKAVNLSTTGADINGDANIDGDLSFRDNDKAIFGAGSDLQIYHSGTDSFIDDAGTGSLYMRSNSVVLGKYTGEVGLVATADGSVDLYYNDVKKLATTSTGIDVTGGFTATTTGTVPTLYGGSGAAQTFTLQSTSGNSNHSKILVGNTVGSDNGGISFYSAGSSVATERMRISGTSGDISFYEDTGTTAKFFWDASAESLGIGTSSPNNMLTLEDGDLQIHETGSSDPLIQLSVGGTQASPTQSWVLRVDNSDSDKFQLLDQTDSRVVLTADGDGNVGIGTDSPSSFWSGGNQLVVGSGTGSQGLTIYSGTTSDAGIYFSDGTVGNALYQGQIFYRHNDDAMVFNTAATERMRIDSSGNLLVGRTSTINGGTNTTGGAQIGANGLIQAAVSGDTAIALQRLTSDGDIIQFRKDNTTVGSIGVASGVPYFDNPTGSGLEFGGGRIYPRSSGAASDNTKDFGDPVYRWDDIYATNGTIQTSDRNEKQDIAELSDAEQRVAVAAKSLLRKFRWRDAVAEKGDEARTHFGIIAQDLQAAFAAEGLDAGDYAMFISSTWTDEDTSEERTRMGVRYSELLAFIIGAL